MNDDLLFRLKKNLPETPGIHGKEEYFNSAVLVSLVDCNGEYHFLFEKRAEGIRQGGEVCFPGGAHDRSVDSGFKDTAIRETAEELGISEDKIEIFGPLDTIVSPMGATIDAFVGRLKIKSYNELTIQSDEVEKLFTVPVSFFMENKPEIYRVRLEVQPSFIDKDNREVVLLPVEELGLPETYGKPWGGKKHKVLVYKTPEGIIWGITALLIYDVVKLMKINN